MVNSVQKGDEILYANMIIAESFNNMYRVTPRKREQKSDEHMQILVLSNVDT